MCLGFVGGNRGASAWWRMEGPICQWIVTLSTQQNCCIGYFSRYWAGLPRWAWRVHSPFWMDPLVYFAGYERGSSHSPAIMQCIPFAAHARLPESAMIHARIQRNGPKGPSKMAKGPAMPIVANQPTIQRNIQYSSVVLLSIDIWVPPVSAMPMPLDCHPLKRALRHKNIWVAV